MSALQRMLYCHMQGRGMLLTDGSEKDGKKVGKYAPGTYRYSFLHSLTRR
jgi:hypothetical protein